VRAQHKSSGGGSLEETLNLLVRGSIQRRPIINTFNNLRPRVDLRD